MMNFKLKGFLCQGYSQFPLLLCHNDGGVHTYTRATLIQINNDFLKVINLK